MKLGIVIGKVVSTRKQGNLTGLKIIIVSQLNQELKATKKTFACVDTVDAGEGDIVLICSSSSARMTSHTRNVATDTAIVGIVDSVSSNGNYIFRKNKSN